jgi:anti-sigma factor RsiW
MIKKCSITKKLSFYIDGELTEDESASIRRHLQTCNFCRIELNRLQSVDQMISGIRNIEPSQPFEKEFWKKINSLKEKKRKRWSLQDILTWRMRPSFIGATAAAVLVMVVVLYVEKGKPKWNPTDLAIAKDLQFYSELDMVGQLDLLENWDDIMSVSERE